ncbi:exosome complex component RRP43-like [Camellia sinensis]|uniref:exosome complex component RRP43-like n=1 Tax=Camellia sinensis TaxID=4442 RepID=UPI001035C067|nr:exosome complex component RRP43-like [Camellia sinensis]
MTHKITLGNNSELLEDQSVESRELHLTIRELEIQKREQKGLSFANASSDLLSEMEVDAFRHLFPLCFHECHLLESIHPDARKLGKARDTTLALGAVVYADGQALAKIGCTTMLAAIKMEVMTPTTESPDEGCIIIDFHMPPICSPIVRPGNPANVAPVISKQLCDTILSSGMINFKELSLVGGKAAWMAYLDIYCLDADGAFFDVALLAAVVVFSHYKIYTPFTFLSFFLCMP